ncbi:MAG: Na+/H+ antiporter NhaC family protein [Chitinophagales bacterium]
MDPEMYFGVLSLIPPLIVILVSILLRSSFEGLLIGCLAGFVMIDGWGFFDGLITSLYDVMRSDDTIWVILVCGLYGSVMALMIRSGGAKKFGESMLKFMHTKRQALMGTWLLGFFVFIDDYLSALTTGITMRTITDKFKIPREYLAYIVNTMSPPVCVIVPISTWTIFIGNILENSGLSEDGKGLNTYFSIIPFVAYGWVAVFMVPLFIYGIIPVFGKMKKAIKRAESTGEIIPEGPKLSSVHFEKFPDLKKPRSRYFLLPLIIILLATVAFQDLNSPGIEIDALKGVMVGVAFTFFYFLISKLSSISQLTETVFSGFNSMVFALALVVISLVLKEVGDKMGLTEFVISSVSPYVSKATLPMLIFISLSLISFTTGSSWGLYIVAIPIVIPLAETVGSNVLLNIGAIISAGVFGANACLYSDATILTAQSTETHNMQHGLTQLPFALLAFGVTCIVYLILGLIV